MCEQKNLGVPRGKTKLTKQTKIVWVLGRAQIAWSTGCGEKTMNTVRLKINKKFN